MSLPATSKHVLTILAVTDVARASRFYQGAFGWPKAVEVPVYVEFSLPGGMRLGLYERRAFARNTGCMPAPIGEGEIGPTELYFHVDDVAAASSCLLRAGARVLSPMAARDWGDEAAYFADLDGNVVVVARPLPPAGTTEQQSPGL